MERPDAALSIKASFNNNTVRRITFPNAAKCRLDAVLARIAESFALGASSFHIAYTDDYGEDFDIVSEADLTEAIAYFSSGNDPEDYGTSLGAPTLYSADWNHPARENANLPVFHPSSKNKIVLRVHVVVEYDGPSLSDTASFLESNNGYEGGEWDEGAYSSEGGYTEDGSAYSSGYNARSPPRRTRHVEPSNQDLHSASGSRNGGYSQDEDHGRSSESLHQREMDTESSSSPFEDNRRASYTGHSRLSLDDGIRGISIDSRRHSPRNDYSPQGEEDPAGSRVSLGRSSALDSRTSLDRSLLSSNPTDSYQKPRTATQSSLTNSELGARWIREQTERARRKLGPASSASSSRSSLSGEDGSDDDETSVYSEGRGNLELVRESNGKWYYSYSSTDMRLQEPQEERHLSQRDSFTSTNSSPSASVPRRDTTSLRLSTTTLSTDPADEDHSGEISPVETESLQTPPELSDEFEEPVGPPGLAPDCSACGTRLEYMRYVCTICGEGHFWLENDISRPASIIDDRDGEDSSSSASSGEQTTWAPPRKLSNSTQVVGDSHPLYTPEQGSSGGHSFSLPKVPAKHRHSGPTRDGYELCPACIEIHGIEHTKAMSEIELSQPGEHRTIQSKVRKLGALNHTYKELLWGAKGWKEIEYHDKCRCSICQIDLYENRYKCISCPNFDLCRNCHNNAQEIHPAHPFLAVPDQRPSLPQPPPAPPSQSTATPIINYSGMNSTKHPGIFCHNCMQDIVGPRFHCAICPNWDVCAQCEPVTSAETGTGSHTSDHIMMKIPLPLASSEVRQVSRRAREQWAQRDSTVVLAAGSIMDENFPVRPPSPTTETVYGGATLQSSLFDHGTACRACRSPIVGERYQCANCPSEPQAYNLCSSCERTSYTVHDPMHVFLKFDRPVHFPLQSTLPILPLLYKTPVGQVRSTMPLDTRDPTAYLRCVEHRSTICDVHVGPIQGIWLRCVHCASSFDVCAQCEKTANHDPTHVFVVFKAEVDMPKFRALAALSAEHSRPLILQRCYLS